MIAESAMPVLKLHDLSFSATGRTAQGEPQSSSKLSQGFYILHEHRYGQQHLYLALAASY